MFTGIVTSIGEVRSVKPRADNLHRITIACDYPRADIVQGASIACSGVCLTVVEADEEGGSTWFAVDAGDETLRVTTAGRWRPASKINLERALKFGDELGGHLVAGHVDGIATVLGARGHDGNGPLGAARAARGRALYRDQGIGCARWRLAHGQRRGGGYIFGAGHPHTLRVTTLGELHKGNDVNLEIDTMARYAARLAEMK